MAFSEVGSVPGRAPRRGFCDNAQAPEVPAVPLPECCNQAVIIHTEEDYSSPFELSFINSNYYSMYFALLEVPAVFPL